ncbi:enterochelin esterase domain-containing protein [Nocardia sp. NPDC058176]|uniref:enterochelin esterase domain-containing protein n=1 Tax=Nocardia sp. NPDC058176 TaxID=3346368 RepID=UPI0036D8B9A9
MTSSSRRTPPKFARPEPAPVVSSPVIAALAHRIEVEGVGPATAGFWAGAVSPIVEPVDAVPGERVVTFLWRDDDAESVLLFVNRITDESDLDASMMRRVPGTDIWHLSYRMGSDWRASYAFLVQRAGQRAPWLDADDHLALRRALDSGAADPLNPLDSRNQAGTRLSVVELPDAPAQRWLAPRAGVPRGTLTRREGPGGRAVRIYRPADSARATYPVVVFFDGEAWTGPQDVPTTLDNLIDDGLIEPCYAILIDSGGTDRRWELLGADGGVDRWLATELLPWARREYPIGPHRADVTVVGQSLGGAGALLALARYPAVIGQAISQSASVWQDEVPAAILGADLRGTRAYVEVGAQEWVLVPLHRPLVERLRAAGAEVAHVEFNGGHDYACWRGGIADGLRWLNDTTGTADSAR